MKKMLHTKALITKANVQDAGVIDGIIGSSNVVDRMGDIIDQSGWNLKNFLNNPVILWAHNSGLGEDRPPIGKALKVWIEDKGKPTSRLMFRVQFDLQDAFAAEIFRKVKDGFLNTVSVGFMPTEWTELDPGNWFGGLKYLEQELLELSIVPVPANPEALIQLNSFAQTDKRFSPIAEKEFFPQVQDNRYKKMIKESKALTLAQVSENKTTEFVRELINVDAFNEESFRAIKLKKGEKEYVAIIGQMKDSEAFVEQSFRFQKDAWTEDEFNAFTKEADDKEDGEKVETPVTPVVADEAITTPEEAKDEQVTETESEEKSAEEADEEITDESELINVNAGQLKGMMVEVWKDGYEAGDESDDKKAMGVPEDNIKVKAMKVGQCKALMNECFSGMKPEKALDELEVKADDSVLTKSMKEIGTAFAEIAKSGRVLSAKNEQKLREASGLLDDVLSAVSTEEEETDDGTTTGGTENDFAKALPFKALGTYPETEVFDAFGEIAKASIEDLKEMATVQESEEAKEKSDFLLVHHKAEDKKAVWRGVASSMAILMGAKEGIELTDEERKACYDHLAEHYKEFEKEVPAYELVEKQVLANLDEEVHALVLDREDKHMVKLIKRVLDNQKEVKKAVKTEIPAITPDQAIKALEIINLALSKVKLSKGGEK